MEIAFELTPLVAAKLITYSFGALIHLFLMVLILGQRRMRRFEWLLFALVSALFMWNSGNLLALNVTLVYGIGSANLTLFFRLIPFLGAIFSVPLLVHVHLEYALPLRRGAGRVHLARALKRPLIALFYLPLIGLPWLVGGLLGRLRAAPLLALEPYTRLVIVWSALALAVAALINVQLWQVAEDHRLKVFHGRLGGIEAVLAAGFCWTYLVRALPSMGLGGYGATGLMALAVVPGALVAHSIFRYNLFDLRVQRHLMYSIAAIFVLLIYLNFIRRLSGFLEERSILPSAVTEGLMIFLLVILLEPVKKWMNGVLERAFASEFGRVRELAAEIQEFANRSGDVAELARFVAQRVPHVLGLERVALDLGSHRGELESASGPPGRAQVLPIRRGEQVIASLEVVPTGHDLSGEQMASLQLLAGQLAAGIELCQLITQKVRLERELAEKAKMAFLGEMAARIAHNVKNPLSSMKTVVQLLEEDPSASERVRQDCRLVVGEIDRLNANISQVLRFAKPARDTDRVVDLVKVVQSILSLTRAEAKRRGVTLELESDCGVCLVEGGEEAVSDIVSNLLVNALDAAGPNPASEPGHPPERGGRQPQRVTVKMSASPTDLSASLSVDDQGPGVLPEIKSSIFQPFFTTRPGGTGLGLAIVARRIEEIGGAIECISPLTREGGTRFLVRFRAARVREPAVHEA